ncbi:MAG: HTH domain-containing protein [Clostridia bacterium]|nr:HTH domain-containing protein [Clostridia bacterium]
MIDLNKKIELCILADFYGNLLTEKQQQIFEMYYQNDMSLFEIAEELKITRQAVHDSLAKAEQQLYETEKKCGFVEKYNQTKADLLKLQSTLDTTDALQAKISAQIHKIITKL